MSDLEPRETPIDDPDPDALSTATVGLVGTLLVIVIVVWLQGLYESVNRGELQRKIVDEAPAELRGLRATQRTRLQETGWVDKQNGIVAIPIARAMELLVRDADPAAPIVRPDTPATPPPGAPAVAK